MDGDLGGAAARLAEDELVEAIDALAELDRRGSGSSRGSLFATHRLLALLPLLVSKSNTIITLSLFFFLFFFFCSFPFLLSLSLSLCPPVDCFFSGNFASMLSWDYFVATFQCLPLPDPTTRTDPAVQLGYPKPDPPPGFFFLFLFFFFYYYYYYFI
jgi:hypothetical protein